MDENYVRILKELQNKIYKNIYFLFGDEPYYIDLISEYISKNVLEESERAFNQITIYGEETDTPSIINTSRRFPMMSNYQVVIIKEAQYLKDLDQLKSYIEAPLSSTILVICYKYKNLDKRTSLYKSLDRSVNAELFHSKKLRDYQVPGWIDNYFREKNITADRDVSMILTEYLGADLSKIVNELNKLFISLPDDQKRISAVDIEEKIGISKEFNNFELQNAIAQKNILKANRIIQYFEHNQRDNPISVTVATIFSFFRRLLVYHYLNDKSRNNVASVLGINPFFVNEYELASRNYTPNKTVNIIGLIREFDMKSKGIGNVSAGPGDLLKELLFKILH